MAAQPEPFATSPAVGDAGSALAIGAARRSFFSTSVGTKVLIGTTGLLLFLYLVLHLLGNIIVLFGPAKFNGYSEFLLKNPLIVPIEIGLLAIFLIHIYKTVLNWASNRRARPVPYEQSQRRLFGYGWAGSPSRKNIASTTMIVTGLITLVFVAIHLQQFKFGPDYQVAGGAGQPVRDLYRLEMENFSRPLNVFFYVFCMVIVGSHLWHGFSSAFQSLGQNYPWLTPVVLRGGKIVAFVIAAGFLLIPIWAYMNGGR